MLVLSISTDGIVLLFSLGLVYSFSLVKLPLTLLTFLHLNLSLHFFFSLHLQIFSVFFGVRGKT